ncbi:hypothetical protein CDD81_4552 [Ophiocordyceps australis]|uniref:NADP-dependent oxidoreductase domain-containing protein n=1 Tax=Ophiocordyceps australis TaxID=1399860 RepID=A0A2C5Y6Z2_9HYPO|nr:hypothetical protein CDD81_4552 [Ophiocordyceps australis]
MAVPRKPLSQVLPPLILGTATFNTQYHPDPAHMPYTEIVRRALKHQIAAFDTSPYYGPAELLLGDALRSLAPPPPRHSYLLISKAGRIAANEFDYSSSWIRYSVCRSLDRLGTPYLDLVYAHDVEFVSPAEVLEAVGELRRMRDQGLVRYIGISGYPVGVLASLAEMVLDQTGEPLDAIMSYGNFCIQNSLLGRQELLERFCRAGVDCVLNASMLGMGLLTSRGVSNGPQASWHPAPPQLRQACSELASIAAQHGEHVEEIAIRWALENWARTGAPLGTSLCTSSAASALAIKSRIGVSVMGVTAVEELEETWRLWESVVGQDSTSAQQRDKVAALVQDLLWPSLGPWKDYAWESGEGHINLRHVRGVIPHDGVAERWGLIPKLQPAVDGASAKI